MLCLKLCLNEIIKRRKVVELLKKKHPEPNPSTAHTEKSTFFSSEFLYIFNNHIFIFSSIISVFLL